MTDGSDIGTGVLPIEQLPMAAALLSLDGVIRATNSAFCHLFGIDGDGAGTPGQAIADPVDTSWPTLHLERSARGVSDRQPVHHRFRRIDGGRVVANLRTSPVLASDDRVVGMIACFTPANADLPNRYQLLWQALEDQQELMIEWALDGTIMFCNRACRVFFGWDETVIGRNLDEIYDWGPDDSRVLTVSGTIAGVRDEPRARVYSEDRIVEWADTAVRDQYSNVTSVFSMGRDVTARVRAEELVRINERRFRAMVNNIQDTVLLVDASGALIDRISVGSQGLGYDATEFTGRSLREFLHPDDLAAAGTLLLETRALAEGATAWAELRARRTDGSYAWLEVSGVNLLSDPNVVAFVFTVRNIDDRKRVEHELGERSRRAQAELRERLSLVAQVGHELRNPLQGIQAFSDVLASADLAPRSAEAASAIGHQADALRRVVDDLLDASQLDLGTLRVHHEVVDLCPVLDEVMVVARQLAQPGVAVSFQQVPNHLRYVLGDAARIRQALANLLSNACKHTAAGTIVLEASSGHADRSVRLSVLDTGSGIAEEDVERLFRPFERGDEAERASTPGIGLGLSIVTGIAAALGGTAGASARATGGSVFWIEFPAADAPADTAPEVADPRADIPHRRVLIVDDEPLNLLANSFLLADLGAEVTTAASAEEALAICEHTTFDVVLADVHLPGIDGFEMTRRLRAAASPGPVIAIMSGDTSADAVQRGAEAGADTYLSKPAAVADLAAVLRRHRE